MMDANTAARTIQAFFRRYRQRKQYAKIKDAAIKIQTRAKQWLSRQQSRRLQEAEERDSRFQLTMQRHLQRIQVLERERRELSELGCQQLGARDRQRHRAAATIQASWRCFSARRRYAHRRRGLQQQQQQATGPAAGELPSSTGRLLAPEHARTPAAAGPHGQAAGGGLDALAATSAQVAPCRISGVSSQRLHQLNKQIDLRLAAHRAAAAATRGGACARSDAARALDLLRARHRERQQGSIRAVLERQKVLQAAEALCVQLEQLPGLTDVAASPEQHMYPALLAGGDPLRAARARQAHALALAETKPGSRWWLPLKQLNQQSEAAAAAAVAAGASGSGFLGLAGQQQWAAQDLALREAWQRIRQQAGGSGR